MNEHKNKKNTSSMVWIQRLIPPVISLTIFVVVALLMSCVPSIQFHIDEYFWAGLIGSPIAVMLTYVVWIPTGEEKALQEQKVINGQKAYNTYANYIIQHQMFDKLKEFCDYKNEELRVEIIKDMLSTLSLNYDFYLLYCNYERTSEEQKKFDNIMKNLSKQQILLLERLKKRGVKFEKLEPKNITIGKVTKHQIVNHNNENKFRYSKAIMKSTWGVAATCFTYFVTIAPNDSFGIAQITMIIMWFFTFLLSIYSAIRTGYTSIAVHRHNYNINQAELCAEFLAYAGINKEEVSVDYGKEA